MVKLKQVMSQTPQMVDLAELLMNKARQYLLAQTDSVAENCIQAIILFQASMEAVINEEIETHRLLSDIKQENQQLGEKFRVLSFRNKWIKAYQTLALESHIHFLNRYLDFYTKFRIPITHPQSRFTDITGYTFKNTIQGLENGWNAMHILLQGLGKNSFTTTWKQFLAQRDN